MPLKRKIEKRIHKWRTRSETWISRRGNLGIRRYHLLSGWYFDRRREQAINTVGVAFDQRSRFIIIISRLIALRALHHLMPRYDAEAKNLWRRCRSCQFLINLYLCVSSRAWISLIQALHYPTIRAITFYCKKLSENLDIHFCLNFQIWVSENNFKQFVSILKKIQTVCLQENFKNFCY